MIAIVGVSHRTAPLAIREALAFPKQRLSEALVRLRAEPGVAECVILSTCNRVELYADVPSEAGTQAVASFLAAFHGQRLAELEPHIYRTLGDPAIRHAFEVAASLDSMVVGEAQILGQVKAAYEAAEEAGTLGPVLTTLRNRTLAAAKRVRSQTEIGRNAVSVSHVAVELARKIFGDLAGRSILLVGAGKMSELAARQLVRGGARATVVGGRTSARAETLAKALGSSAVPFESLRDEMARADVVISSTGAPHVVIRREDVEDARRLRGRRPLFLVDIAAPRDIEASVRDLPGVFLYDLDDLKTVAEANRELRARQAGAARAIVEQEIEAFADWRRSREALPLLVELRKQAEWIRRTELEKARSRLSALSPEQLQAVEAVATAIVNKLLHAPTVYLKDAARSGQAGELVLVSRLLGLEAALRPGSEGERLAASSASAAPARLHLDPA